MRSYVFFSLFIAFILVCSCQKKEETQPIPKVPIQQTNPSSDATSQTKDSQIPKMSDNPMMNPHGNIKKTEKKIEVPDNVKKKWSKAVIVVEDRKNNKKSEHTINIGSELKIAGSRLTLKTGEFIPDFKMTESTITTASAELNNPALRVEINEDNNLIFKGWLYQKFPEVHPFEHEQFSIRLKQVMP